MGGGGGGDKVIQFIASGSPFLSLKLTGLMKSLPTWRFSVSMCSR